MECSCPPMIASNKGIINIDADNLYRAQCTDSVMMTIRSWINEYTGEVDDKNINMQEMDELHAEVKQMYTVRKHIKLMEASDQIIVKLLCMLRTTFTVPFSSYHRGYINNFWNF